MLRRIIDGLAAAAREEAPSDPFARLLAAGLVTRDGMVTGVHAIVPVERDGRLEPMLHVAARTRDAHAWGAVAPLGDGDVGGQVARLLESESDPGRRSEFPQVIERLLRLPQTPALQDLVGRDLARTMADADPGLDAAALANKAVDRLAEVHGTASRFLRTLSPEAARIVDDLGVELLSLGGRHGCWEGVDETFVPGAPLREALRTNLAIAPSLVEAWGSDPGIVAASRPVRPGARPSATLDRPAIVRRMLEAFAGNTGACLDGDESVRGRLRT